MSDNQNTQTLLEETMITTVNETEKVILRCDICGCESSETQPSISPVAYVAYGEDVVSWADDVPREGLEYRVTVKFPFYGEINEEFRAVYRHKPLAAVDFTRGCQIITCRLLETESIEESIAIIGFLSRKFVVCWIFWVPII